MFAMQWIILQPVFIRVMDWDTLRVAAVGVWGGSSFPGGTWEAQNSGEYPGSLGTVLLIQEVRSPASYPCAPLISLSPGLCLCLLGEGMSLFFPTEPSAYWVLGNVL